MLKEIGNSVILFLKRSLSLRHTQAWSGAITSERDCWYQLKAFLAVIEFDLLKHESVKPDICLSKLSTSNEGSFWHLLNDINDNLDSELKSIITSAIQ
jgi:hypothetical protein